MTDTISIPLNKLLAWEGNVRKTDTDKSINELAASIFAHGLLQSLVVRKDKRGKYAVVAGRRRLLALESLVESGSMKAQTPIPCTVLDDEADATEISLAENVQREAMHPADEFDAFKALTDKGTPPADVAARFGVTETVVKQRLKLANASPTLIAAYRNGEMTLQHVMAFTVTDDHEAQERVWNELSDYQSDPDDIRATLTEQEVTAADRRVKFVTLKAYEKAGGTVRRDLFSQDDLGVFIEDIVLLETLVARKLEKAAQKLRNEGWKWVEVVPSFVYSEWSKCERRHAEPLPLPPDQQSELDALTTELESLNMIDEPTDEQQAHLDVINERMDELEDRPDVWPTETLAIAGAVVTLGSKGEPEIHYGFIRPEDVRAISINEREESEDGMDVSVTERPALSASLVENLTSHRSAALNAALLERPDVALATIAHVMALQVVYNGRSENTCLQIEANDASLLTEVEGSAAHAFIEAAREHWVSQMPGEPDGLFAWCLSQNGDTLRGLLTFCVAQTINAVMQKSDRLDSDRILHGAQLAEALNLDMSAWFKPTAANYFGRIGKSKILETLSEVKGSVAPAWEKLKKTELAALAEREVSGKDWLPELLRSPVPEITPELKAA